MSSRKILLIQGHPDHRGDRFGHALEQAYSEGAAAGGHNVRVVRVADIEFPLLRSQDEWQNGELPQSLKDAQEAIAWAQHIVIFFPLWLGTMPALLKGFFEQVFRPGFAISKTSGADMWKKGLTGKSARVVVTMGMPALVYRWFFRAHALKGLERNILRFCGIAPVEESVIGSVEGGAAHHAKWLERMRALGQKAK
jgi:putative NADPH-quinone reductase